MKLRRNHSFRRKEGEFERKNGSTTFVSRREEIKNNKLRKKGLIK